MRKLPKLGKEIVEQIEAAWKLPQSDLARKRLLVEIKKKLRDCFVEVVAKLLKPFASDPRYFECWQRHGYHVLPVDDYSVIPNTSALPDDIFAVGSGVAMEFINGNGQLLFLNNLLTKFSKELCRLGDSKGGTSAGMRFTFSNTSFGPVDAEVLYGIVRSIRPKRVIEIGSGFSTLVFCEALASNKAEGADCELTAIEPFPRAFLKNDMLHPVHLVEELVQNVPLSKFQQLKTGDILFIDSSHVVKIGSDAHREFLEIIPVLASGVVIHIHDIFLPMEYPRDWIMKERRFWNEQYILQALLTCGREFEVLWAGAHMRRRFANEIEAAFARHKPEQLQPSSFWIRKK